MLLLRYIFYNLIIKNISKYLLLLISTILVCAFFVPILQIEFDIYQKQSNIFKKSIKFDNYYNLPKHNRLVELKEADLIDNTLIENDQVNDNEIFEKIIQPIKKEYDFDTFFISRNVHTNLKDKKIIFFEVGFDAKNPVSQKFNKVVIQEGVVPNADAINEVVLNEKYMISNDLSIKNNIQNSIEIFKRPFKIVGVGESAQRFSLAFRETYQIQNQLNLNSNNDNLYDYAGIAYVDRSQFETLFEQKAFNNFSNTLYVKFNKDNVKEASQAIKKVFSEKINYIPKSTSFKSDISSGMKSYFSLIEIVFLGASFLLILVFMMSVLIYLVNYSFAKKNNYIRTLKIIGFSRKEIINNYFYINFFLFLIASSLGYFLGFILNNYFVETNNRLFFIYLKYDPFNYFSFFIIISFFALTFGLTSFFIGWRRINDLYWKRSSIQFFKKLNKSNPYIAKIRMLFIDRYRFKMFFFIFFRDFRKKIIIFISITLIFVLSFLLIFTKVASDNFLYNQWSFLNPDVKSFTKFKNRSIFVNPKNNKIDSNITFIPEKEILLDEELEVINDISFENFLNSDSWTCFEFNQNNLNLDCVFKNKKISSATFKNEEIKKNMEIWGVENVYFNISPYYKDQELPVLNLDFIEQITIDQENEDPYKVDGFSSQAFFLPKNWNEFFKINKLKSQSSDFSFGENGEIGFFQKNQGEYIANALVSENLEKKGYKLNDTLEFKFGSEDIYSKKNIKIKIVGFVGSEILLHNHIFLDYDFLYKHQLVDDLSAPYNFIFSKNEKKNLRNLVFNINDFRIDLSDVNINEIFSDVMLNATNLESLTIKEYQNLSGYHFKLFQFYLIITLLFGVIISFFSLIALIAFVIEKQERTISTVMVFGYRVYSLIYDFIINFIIIFIFGLLFAFLISYLLFDKFVGNFREINIYFNVNGIWSYLIYILILFVFCILSTLIYYWYYFFKKKKLDLKF